MLQKISGANKRSTSFATGESNTRKIARKITLPTINALLSERLVSWLKYLTAYLLKKNVNGLMQVVRTNPFVLHIGLVASSKNFNKTIRFFQLQVV